MELRNCIWKGCNEKINVNISIESSKVGQRLGLTVCGWCPLHKKAYHIYHDMEVKRFGSITAKIYRENKKEINQMRKQAEKLARMM